MQPHEELYVLIRAIKAEAFTLTDNRLELHDNVTWKPLGFASSIMFLREFYMPFYKGVLNEFEVSPSTVLTPNFAILGNPGIGKSIFGRFLFFLAVHKTGDRAVVYINGSSKNGVFLQGDAIWKFRCSDSGGIPQDVADALLSPTSIFICDSMAPPALEGGAFTVLITSPDRRVWYEWTKQARAKLIVFPVWTVEEALSCNDILGAKTYSREDLLDRFAICGGNARLLSDVNLSVESLEQAVNDALPDYEAKLSLLLTEDVHLETAAGTFPHRLVALQPLGGRCNGVHVDARSAEFYKYGDIKFMSDFAEEAVAAKFEKKAKAFWDKFLDVTQNIPLLGTVRGRILERKAIPVLAAGGDFVYRELTADGQRHEERTLTLPQVNMHGGVAHFANLDHLGVLVREDPDRMFVADRQNECAIDAILSGGKFLVNFTVSTEHPIVMVSKRTGGNGETGLKAVAEKLGMLSRGNGRGQPYKAKPVSFFFAVPHDGYEYWTKPQRLVGWNRDDAAANAVAGALKQYVLRLPPFFGTSRDSKKRRGAAAEAKDEDEDEDENEDEGEFVKRGRKAASE